MLDETLATVLINSALGGSDCPEDGQQAFGAIALRGNRLALGGTTCAGDLAAVRPAQAAAGGGQDGFVVVLDLW